MTALQLGGRLTALAIAVTLAGVAGAQSAPVGFVAGYEGSVELRGGAAGSWTLAAVDQELHLGDSIRTGPASALKVLLVDDTVLSIGEETELRVDKFVVGAAATTEPSVLELLSGQMRVQVGEAFGGVSNLQVHTPTAVIGVKGTVFEVVLALSLLTVCDWQGKVFVEIKNSNTRKDLQKDLCTEGWTDLSEPFPIPPDFSTVGPGPSAGTQVSSADVSPYVETTPPVAAGPDGGIDIGGEIDPVIDNEDALAVKGDDMLDGAMDGMEEDMMPPAMEEGGGGPVAFPDPTDDGEDDFPDPTDDGPQ